MKEFLKQIVSKKTQSLEASRKAYWELLVKLNSQSETEQEIDQLSELMADIGLTAEQVNVDIAIVQKAVENFSAMEELKDIDSRLDQAHYAMEKAQEDYREKLAALQSKLTKAIMQRDHEHSENQRKQTVIQQLKKLNEHEPILYGILNNKKE